MTVKNDYSVQLAFSWLLENCHEGISQGSVKLFCYNGCFMNTLRSKYTQ